MNRVRMIANPLLGAVLGAALLHARADEVAEVRALARSGQAAEAMMKLDQFIAIKPADPQLRFFKGVLLTENNRAADAVAVFTKLTEEHPELPEPYNNLAVLYAGLGQYDKARNALEAAIRSNPGYATAHENLGDVYARLAAQAYARALALDPSNAALHPKLALVRTLVTPKTPDTRATIPARPSKANSQ